MSAVTKNPLPAAMRRKLIKMLTAAVNEGRMTQMDAEREPLAWWGDSGTRNLLVGYGDRTYYTAHFYVDAKRRRASPKKATAKAGKRKR
jgi:uncharacterized protein (UPF0218 family)